MSSILFSSIRAWSRLGVATLVVMVLAQQASAVGLTATNTTESDAAPVVLLRGTGIYTKHAEPFRLTSDGSSARISFVEAYTTNANPFDLRIGIYANTLDFQTLPPPAIGTIAVDVPDMSQELIHFAAPIVTSINDGFDTFWTAQFAAIGVGPGDITLPSSSSPYWIVYSLANDGTLDLDGVAAQSSLSVPYFGDSARTDHLSGGQWTIQNRAVAASIEYVAVPEIDPSSVASALSLLVGAIALGERRSRRVRG